MVHVPNFWQVNANGSESVVFDASAAGGVDVAGLSLNGFGTFTKSGNTLVWTTAVSQSPTPALALVGLAAAGFVARRRAAAYLMTKGPCPFRRSLRVSPQAV